MKKLALSLILCVSMLFSGCAGFNSASVANYTPTIKATASIATGEALVSITDVTKRKEVANYIYSIATGARTLSGQVPTVDEVQSTLKQYLGTEYNDQLANLVVTLSGLYSDYLSKEVSSSTADADKVKAAASILEAIAEGAEQAATSYK